MSLQPSPRRTLRSIAMRAAISQGLRLLVLVLAVPVLYLQDPHWFR